MMCFRRVCLSAEFGFNFRVVFRVFEKRKIKYFQLCGKLIFIILGLGRKDKVIYQYLFGNVVDNRGIC